MFGRSKLATKCRRGLQVQPGGDLGVRGLGRGRGQRDPRYVGPALVQLRQHQVVGPEVVAPLGHTVRLVDREQRDLALVEQPRGRLDPEPLGRQVEQVEVTGQEGLLDLAALLVVLGRVEETGPDPERGQRVDLVLHQRDQRRDDHPDTGPDQRRDLVAQRLAATGRHQHQGVTAADDGLDDVLLLAPERVVPEHPVQDLQGLARGVVQRLGRLCHPAILRRSRSHCWPPVDDAPISPRYVPILHTLPSGSATLNPRDP